MHDRDSISFGSIKDSSVWHNQDPPTASLNLSVTFNQLAPSSRNYLEESMIRRIPAQKSQKQLNQFMRNNLDVVCLLQTAQIRRLTSNLQEHQVKFKQLQSQPLDRQSYEIQIRELAETSHQLQQLNIDLNNRCQRMKQFVLKQNAEISKLSDQLKQRERRELEYGRRLDDMTRMREELFKTNEEFTMTKDQLQIVTRKYQKSISSLNKLYQDNEQLTGQVGSLEEQNTQLQEETSALKYHIVEIKQRIQVFEQERIREIQRMRESYQQRMFEENSHFQSEGKKELLKVKHQNTKLQSELQTITKMAEERVKNLLGENQHFMARCQQLNSQLQSERETSNIERQDFDSKFKMFGDEIERLNQVLAEKELRINDMFKQMEELRVINNRVEKSKQQAEKHQHKNTEHQHELQRQITSLRHSIHQTQTSLKLQSDARLAHELHNQLLVLRKAHQEQLLQVNQYHQEQLQTVQQSYSNQTTSLKQSITNFQSRIAQILTNSSQNSSTQEQIIRNYEQKIREYFEQLQGMKRNKENLEKEYELVSQENAELKKQSREKSIQMNEGTRKQINELRERCTQLSRSNSMIEVKVKNLQRQKQAIERQLQKQLIRFMQNNTKTSHLLQQHNHNVELVNYQRQYTNSQREYTSNHLKIMHNIQQLSQEFLLKQEEIVMKQQRIEGLEKEITRLVEIVLKLELELRNYHSNLNQIHQEHDNAIGDIQEGIAMLSLEKNLTQQNTQLMQKLQHTLVLQRQLQQITRKCIELSEVNTELRQDREQTLGQFQRQRNKCTVLETSLKMIKEQYQQVILERQRLFETVLKKENYSDEQFKNKESLLTNNKIEHLLQQFKEMNQQLLQKITMLEFKQSNSTSQDVHFSFNPNKFLQSTKLLEDTNNHVVVENLRQQIKELEKKNKNQMITLNSTNDQLSQENNLLRQRLKQIQNQKYNLQQDNKQFQSLANTSKKLVYQNNLLMHQIQSLMQQIKTIHVQLQNMIKERDELRVEIEDKSRMVKGYNERLGLMSGQIQQCQKELREMDGVNRVMETENQTLKQENISLVQQLHPIQQQLNLLIEQVNYYRTLQPSILNQASNLKRQNHHYALQLQKTKVTTSKVQVLNHQLQRLQKQNISLVEELDYCKFEICQQVQMERRNEELLAILVMTIVEVESLRAMIKQKDHEVATVRAEILGRGEHMQY